MTRPRLNIPLFIATALTTALFAALTHHSIGTAAGLVAVVTAIFVRRLDVDRVGQIIVALVSGAIAYGLVIALDNTPQSPAAIGVGPVSTVASLAFLLIAATRLMQPRPYGGDGGTAAATFLSTLSLGAVSSGWIYPVFSVSIVIGLAMSLRFSDPHRPTGRALIKPYAGTVAVILAIAAAVFGALVATLPPLYQKAFGLFESVYDTARTGFGFSLELGDLSGMEQSDEVVMRLRGPRTDYLRGVVYTRYFNGRWFRPSDETQKRTTLHANASSPVERVHISLVGGDRDTYFLPLDADDVDIPDQPVLLSTNGLVAPADGAAATAVSFTRQGDTPPASSPKDDALLEIPRSVASTIRELAETWSSEADGDKEALAAIASRLKRSYDYALDVKLPGETDPLIEFLTRAKRGHCEYFASAMALMARARGVPSRVVGGYRVHEHNPLGDYDVVRERNAHAWVEVYLPDEGWRTIDPTPPLEGLPGQTATTPLVSALLDVAADALRKAGRRLAGMTATQITSGIAALLLLWTGIRLVRRVRFKKRKERHDINAYRDPLPALSHMLTRLGNAGLERHRNEPLEIFAGRVAQSDRLGSQASPAADLLRRYIAWRFGDEGDPDALTGELERWNNEPTANGRTAKQT